MKHDSRPETHPALSNSLCLQTAAYKKWGGALLFLCFIPLLLRAQFSCSPYEFEVVKTAPNVSHYPSGVAGPSAYHTYYTVRLKPVNPQGVFNGAWQVNFVEFHGMLNVNNFTTYIDRDLTLQLAQGGVFATPYFSFLDLPALANGEVIWKVGQEENCQEPVPANTITLPVGKNGVDLFTIAVAGTPGDYVNFFMLGGTVCIPFCSGAMNVTHSTTLDVTFPTPAYCLPSVTATFVEETISNIRFIKVSLNGLNPNNAARKIDGVIHINPVMNGITDLDLIPNPDPNFWNTKKRKNADGSFDIYFFSIWPLTAQWPISSIDVMLIEITGQYNLSQGGKLSCSLQSGRGSFSNQSGTWTCSLAGVPNDILIDGYPTCPDGLTISATRYVGAGCQLGARYTLTFQGDSALNLNRLHLLLGFNTDNTANAPLQVDAPQLPCPSCWTQTMVEPGFYTYEYTNPGPLTLPNGTTITIPFSVSQDCIRYFILMADAVPSGAADTCALTTTIDLNNFPACDPAVHGQIVLSDDISGLNVPHYMVSLIGQSGYLLQNFDDCAEDYSFCPDLTKAPFVLRVNTAPTHVNNYGCGTCVSAFDMLLINRHILGLQLLAPPYRMIAADVNSGDGAIELGISTFDMVEIRKCILGTQSNFGLNSNPSWWYINDNYQLPNMPAHVFNPDSLGWRIANSVNVPVNSQNPYGIFHAVKVGDVNLNCNCTGFPPFTDPDVANRSGFTGFRIDASKIRNTGGSIIMPVYGNAPFGIAALQGGFRFDASALSLTRIIPNEDAGVAGYQFGTVKAADGEVRFVWIPEDGVTLLPGDAWLFSLEFAVKNGAVPPAGQFCWLSDNILNSVVYPADGRELPANLLWETAEREMLELGLMVNPNPFRETAKVFVYSGKAQEGIVRLQDSRGGIRMQQPVELIAGDNTLEIQTDVPPGVYFVVVESAGNRIFRRVVKI